MSSPEKDPYTGAVFGYANKFARVAWWWCYLLLFRFSPRPFFRWRRFLLCLFGAKLENNVHIYPGAKIWAPWNLECHDMATIASGAEIYNPATVRLGSHSIVSQDAYLCGATHDYNDVRFPFVAKPISIGAYAWICARATVMPGVTVHEGAVLGLGSVATRDLDAWSVFVGLPAKFVKMRSHTSTYQKDHR